MDKTCRSIVGSGALVVGNLVAEQAVEIDGIFEGDIHGTEVIIGPAASVKGSIDAITMHLAGSLEGKITAKEAYIKEGASFVGEVICDSICVEGSANIRVHCKVTPALIPYPQHKISVPRPVSLFSSNIFYFLYHL